jgi:IS5 family transposase
LTGPAIALWRAKVRHHEPLVEKVITQSERRVLYGETVPARDKLVSLYSHRDAIAGARLTPEIARVRGQRVIGDLIVEKALPPMLQGDPAVA